MSIRKNPERHRDQREQKLTEIALRCAKLPDQDNRSAEEILGYDEVGLPR